MSDFRECLGAASRIPQILQERLEEMRAGDREKGTASITLQSRLQELEEALRMRTNSQMTRRLTETGKQNASSFRRV